jgi:hypothetical protein
MNKFLAVKILKLFYADPGSLRPWIQEEKIRIQDIVDYVSHAWRELQGELHHT